MATTHRVKLIPVLSDNYVIVLHDGSQAAVVDPAVGEPVVAVAAEPGAGAGGRAPDPSPRRPHRWHALSAAPLAAGVGGGLPCRSTAASPFQTVGVSGGDRFNLLGRPVEVIEVPGHTRAHLAYFLPAPKCEGVTGVEPGGCRRTLLRRHSLSPRAAGGCSRAVRPRWWPRCST